MKTYPFPTDFRKTRVVKAILEGGQIRKLSYIPTWMNKDSVPELLSRNDKRSKDVVDDMDWLCKDQGLETRFSWDGDEVTVLT